MYLIRSFPLYIYYTPVRTEKKYMHCYIHVFPHTQYLVKEGIKFGQLLFKCLSVYKSYSPKKKSYLNTKLTKCMISTWL